MNKKEFLKKLPVELLDYLLLNDNQDKIQYILYLFESNMIKNIAYSDELDVYLLITNDGESYAINDSAKLKTFLRDEKLNTILYE